MSLVEIASTVAVVSLAVLFVTWVGYPALAVLIARFIPRRTPRVATGAPPRVSVVIATLGPEAVVRTRIDDLRRGEWPNDLLEIVVTLDQATPAADRRALVELDDGRGVRVIDTARAPGKASALNAGVRAATGDVLVFTDTAQRFATDAIPRLVAALDADPSIRLVGGALYLPGDSPGARRSPVEWYWATERALRAAEALIHSPIGVSGSIYALRRDAWCDMPDGLILDDLWLPMRRVLAGERVGYTVDAHAWDVRRTEVARETGRKVRTLTGNFQLLLLLPEVLVPWRNPVWCQFVMHKLMRLVTPWCALCFLLGSALVVAVTWPRLTFLAAAGATALAVLLRQLAPVIAERVTGGVRWAIAGNVALAQATANALRRRWDVWT